MPELSEQEILRREALTQLHELGIEPYPAALYPVTAYSGEILEEFKLNPATDKFKEISIAGRIMTRRIMGAASFAEIQDVQGRIQVYFKRDDLCPGEDKTLY
ncbi:MAG TPA: OB-fold nucleic acid binding domain-containing protein, partial [Bacteroidales bacterium]|nr:OB-fold nucleic acid binding domain-containing protein [Bacteroidales bacterium]